MFDLDMLLRTSVAHNDQKSYIPGSLVKTFDANGDPERFYAAVKSAPVGTSIDNATIWSLLGSIKDGNFKASEELKQYAQVSASVSIDAHDVNRAYSYGDLTYGPDEYGVKVGFYCVNSISKDQNISLTDSNYWKLVNEPKPPINYMVGAAAILFDPNGKVLVGERIDYAGQPIEALFGGKPEYYETLAEGLSREVAEEVGLKIDSTRFVNEGIVEASPGRGFKCITGYFSAALTWEEVAQIQNLEPHKCFALHWRALNEIHKNPLWQNPTSHICQAYSFYFL